MFRLAAKLGIADVDGLANSLSAEQRLEWKAVAVLDGWFDINPTAEVLAAIHNATNRICISSSADPRAAHRASVWQSGWDFIKARFGINKKPKPNAAQVQNILKKRHGR
jgi:hypothetical protein